jgi:hypothetical protein
MKPGKYRNGQRKTGDLYEKTFHATPFVPLRIEMPIKSDIQWLVLVILFAVPIPSIALCIFNIIRRQVRIEKQIGKIPIYETRCSVRINGVIYNFVKISLYDEFLVFITILKKFVVPLSEIRTVKIKHFHRGMHMPSEVSIEPKDMQRYPWILIDSSESSAVYDAIIPLLGKIS